MKHSKSSQANRVRPRVLMAGSVAATVLIALNSQAGIQGSGHLSLLAVGTVTDAGHDGSISVSGTRYSTAGAFFTVDGVPASPQQIRNGDVVWLVAGALSSDGSYAATQVIFNGSVRGKISAIDSQQGTFAVLGQSVHVVPGTVFAQNVRPADLSGLRVGDTVEVSSYANAAGDLVATRIVSKDRGNAAQVSGLVHRLDSIQHAFYINGLRVDYGSAHLEGGLSENLPVRVQGHGFAADGTLLANQVKGGNPAQGQPGELGRIQGLVTSYSSSSYFEVEGQPVIADGRTQLHLAEALALDASVLVAGTFDSNGVLVADSVTSVK